LKLSVFSTEELAEAAAQTFASAIREAITARGTCTFALSRPPDDVLPRLATLDIDWSAVRIFQVDERVAPDGHLERNLTLIERDLGEVVRAATIHPMPVTDPDLDDAALRYGAELESVCGSPPSLDVVHLGLGPDGHTASLLPGDPVLDVRDRLVAVTGEAAGYRRMTLTFPVLDRARLAFLVVAGTSKVEALAGVLGGDMSLPAARVTTRGLRILADRDAASGEP
jgi:6-phosphogluconolactonase